MSDLKVNINGDPKGLIEVSLFSVVAMLSLWDKANFWKL